MRATGRHTRAFKVTTANTEFGFGEAAARRPCQLRKRGPAITLFGQPYCAPQRRGCGDRREEYVKQQPHSGLVNPDRLASGDRSTATQLVARGNSPITRPGGGAITALACPHAALALRD